MDLDEVKPVLLYDIPADTPSEQLKDIIQTSLQTGLILKEGKSEGEEVHHQILLDGKEIEGAWVKIYRNEDKRIAIGFKVPESNEVIRLPQEQKASGITLINGKILEYQLRNVGQKKIMSFPSETSIPSRQVVDLTATKSANGTSKRIPVPVGKFPDQIVTDSAGVLWFTQPNDGKLSSYDPNSKTWSHQEVGAGADGLSMDRKQNFWFGEYYVETLGFYDAVNKKYENFKMPYPKSKPAIPYEARNGLIWVTDHQQNKMSVFNPSTKSFEKVYDAPSSGSWMIQALQTESSDDIFITQCYSNSIGRINHAEKTFKEIAMGVNSCPAFFAAVGDDLWITLWSAGSILKLNTKNESITEFKIRFKDAAHESGVGPISTDGKGNVFFGSLNSGKVYKLNTQTMELVFTEGVRGLKDGLAVGKDGTAWVTEMGGALNQVSF